MNLRILKKLSKRAAPMILALYPEARCQHYLSERGEGDCDVVITDRKHWSRHESVSGETFIGYRGSKKDVAIQPVCRSGKERPFVLLSQPWNPWPGTPMVGWMPDYYEPEWEERTAWNLLCEYAHGLSIDFVPDGTVDDVFGHPNMKMVSARRMPNPSAVLRIAREFMESRHD